jgi:NAD(P)-dependent dehydrogenase (short-subunit alcohol dehydrogenase family)
MKKLVIIGGSKGIGQAIINILKETYTIINISQTAIETTSSISHHTLNILEDDLPEIDTIDALVYCPGSINLKPLSRLNIDDFQNDFNINVIGAIKAIKHFEKALIKGQGSVVLFSSVATQMGMPFHASIATSKAALEGLTKSLAAEYATKIRFNIIAPTITDTPLAARLLRNDKQRETMSERHPLKSILDPKEVAGLTKFLLSSEAKSISGQTFPIDAGITSLKL